MNSAKGFDFNGSDGVIITTLPLRLHDVDDVFSRIMVLAFTFPRRSWDRNAFFFVQCWSIQATVLVALLHAELSSGSADPYPSSYVTTFPEMASWDTGSNWKCLKGAVHPNECTSALEHSSILNFFPRVFFKRLSFPAELPQAGWARLGTQQGCPLRHQPPASLRQRCCKPPRSVAPLEPSVPSVPWAGVECKARSLWYFLILIFLHSSQGR